MGRSVQHSIRFDKELSDYLDREIEKKRFASYNHAVNSLIAYDKRLNSEAVRIGRLRERSVITPDMAKGGS